MSHSPFHYVSGLLVSYKGPTDHRCSSQWVAIIRRGSNLSDRFRVSVTYDQGPDAAAAAVVALFNERMDADWQILGAAICLDNGSSYAYPAGPSYMASLLCPSSADA